MIDYKLMLVRAKKAGACNSALSVLRQFSCFNDALGNLRPWNLALYCFWYAKKVRKSRWKEAEPSIASDSFWRKAYNRRFGTSLRAPKAM